MMMPASDDDAAVGDPGAPDLVMVCTPQCKGRNCGTNGCGGSCGSCSVDDTCDKSGVCQAKCQPQCDGLMCGDDGCKGSCGTCATGTCQNGLCACVRDADCGAGKLCITDSMKLTFCVQPCDPVDVASCAAGKGCKLAMDYANKDFYDCAGAGAKLEYDVCVPSKIDAGDDCAPGLLCVGQLDGSQRCERWCTPNGNTCRAGQTCSALSVGGMNSMFYTCNPAKGPCDPNPCTQANQHVCSVVAGKPACACDNGFALVNGACQCVPQCQGLVCGNDGCGGSCGVCGQGTQCVNGQCQCAPVCNGKVCGDDGCKGSCGNCGQGLQCVMGACKCVPSCNGKVCGDDGCGGSCGVCGKGFKCVQNACNVCVPACNGKACGDDGCGGSCGACKQGMDCGVKNVCCGAPASNCNNSVDCCSNLCYLGDNTCVVCLPNMNLAFCFLDADCCSGNCDDFIGHCNNCKSRFAKCTNAGQCCSGVCKAGMCSV